MSERCACADCDWQGPVTEAGEVRDFWSRIEPGDEFPAGDCPRCGAFAFLIKPPVQVLVLTEQGLVETIYVSPSGVHLQVFVIDTDVEGADDDQLADIFVNGEQRRAFAGAAASRRLTTLTTPYGPPVFSATIGPGEFWRCKAAGYTVEHLDKPEIDDLPFAALSPNEEHLGDFATERAAWEASDNHRMFGDVQGTG